MALLFDPKDPDEVDDFTLDWAAALAADETIAGAAAVAPFGEVAASGPVQVAGALTTVRLTGGTLGQWGGVTIRVTTSRGRVLDETIRLRVQAR